MREPFSGAASDHHDLFEQADVGALFLDEVDSFLLGLQAKLLRVLKGPSVQCLGSTAERAVACR